MKLLIFIFVFYSGVSFSFGNPYMYQPNFGQSYAAPSQVCHNPMTTAMLLNSSESSEKRIKRKIAKKKKQIRNMRKNDLNEVIEMLSNSFKDAVFERENPEHDNSSVASLIAEYIEGEQDEWDCSVTSNFLYSEFLNSPHLWMVFQNLLIPKAEAIGDTQDGYKNNKKTGDWVDGRGDGSEFSPKVVAEELAKCKDRGLKTKDGDCSNECIYGNKVYDDSQKKCITKKVEENCAAKGVKTKFGKCSTECIDTSKVYDDSQKKCVAKSEKKVGDWIDGRGDGSEFSDVVVPEPSDETVCKREMKF